MLNWLKGNRDYGRTQEAKADIVLNKPCDDAMMVTINKVIDGLDLAVRSGNMKSSRQLCEELRRHIVSHPKESLECGSVQALVCGIKFLVSDGNIVDCCINGLSQFGTSVSIHNNDAIDTISISMLLGIQGVEALIHCADYHLANAKIQLITGKLLRLVVFDEIGCRMFVNLNGHKMLLKVLRHYNNLKAMAVSNSSGVRELLALTLSTLSSVVTSQINARKLFHCLDTFDMKLPTTMEYDQGYIGGDFVGLPRDHANHRGVENVNLLVSLATHTRLSKALLKSEESSLEVAAYVCNILCIVSSCHAGAMAIFYNRNSIKCVISILKLTIAVRRQSVELKLESDDMHALRGIQINRDSLVNSAITAGASLVSQLKGWRQGSTNNSVSSSPKSVSSIISPSNNSYSSSVMTMQQLDEKENEDNDDDDNSGYLVDATLSIDTLAKSDDVASVKTPRRTQSTPLTSPSNSTRFLAHSNSEMSLATTPKSARKKSAMIAYSGDSRRAGCWSSMLLHNLCLYARNPEVRLYVATKYEGVIADDLFSEAHHEQPSATSLTRRLHMHVLELMRELCQEGLSQYESDDDSSMNETATETSSPFSSPASSPLSLGNTVFDFSNEKLVLEVNGLLHQQILGNVVRDSVATILNTALHNVLPKRDPKKKSNLHLELKSARNRFMNAHNLSPRSVRSARTVSNVYRQLVRYVARGKLAHYGAFHANYRSVSDNAAIHYTFDFCSRCVLFNLEYLLVVHGYDQYSLVQSVVDQLNKEFHHKPCTIPITQAATRLLSFVFTLISHPLLRRRLVACERTLELLVGRSDDAGDFKEQLRDVTPEIKYHGCSLVELMRNCIPPEFFSGQIKSIQSLLKLSTSSDDSSIRETHWLPQCRPFLCESKSSKSFPLDGHQNFNLHAWRLNATELCKQLSLRHQQLFLAADPMVLLVFVYQLNKHPFDAAPYQSKFERIQKFMDEYDKLVFYLKSQVLFGATPKVRAETIGCIIDIAICATDRNILNASLTMACIEALESNPIRRLELTWRNVYPTKWEQFNDLKAKVNFEKVVVYSKEESGYLSVNYYYNKQCNLKRILAPPQFFKECKVPYFNALLASLQAIYVHQKTQMKQQPDLNLSYMQLQYNILSIWYPNISYNGSWYPVLYQIQPIPHIQILLSKLQPSDLDLERSLQEMGWRQEPKWVLEHMLMESLYTVQSTVESLFELKVNEEYKLLKTFQESVNSLSPKHIGQLIQGLINRVATSRRVLLLKDSGARSSEHWESVLSHVRLCIERIILSPVLSRLNLNTIHKSEKAEIRLQERIYALGRIKKNRLAELLGVKSSMASCRWYSAISSLKSFGMVDLPSLKLEVLLQVKSDIFREYFDVNNHDMTADEFLPVLTYVIVCADLHHPLSSFALLRELLGSDYVSGEAAYYLTSFEIALNHLSEMQLPADVKLINAGGGGYSM